MKPFIWPWSCYRSCLNSAPDLDYRFGEIEMTLSWFSCNGFARLTTLYLFISPWFIFLGFIDNWPRLVRDTDWTFYVQWNFIALFDPEASRLPTRSRHCVCRFFSWNFKTKKKMKFIFNNNKNKQRRRLWVSRNSRSGYLAAKLFSVNCAYFMKWTRKRQ